MCIKCLFVCLGVFFFGLSLILGFATCCCYDDLVRARNYSPNAYNKAKRQYGVTLTLSVVSLGLAIAFLII